MQQQDFEGFSDFAIGVAFKSVKEYNVIISC